ncbi:MAG: FliH/SctL family protein [Rubrivivax sp.]|nr:FliH/SctL family protein [Rubrivivax sp.]
MGAPPKGPFFRNVPPPAGGKPSSPYQRFIPREELGDFASWSPGKLGEQPDAPPAAPPEPTPADWQARIDAARQAGYQDGYRDGLVALDNFKQTFAQQATSQIGALLDSFDVQLSSLDGEMAAALAQSAVLLAQQVLRAELNSHPEVVAQVAAEAVNAVMLSARHIAVHVHPADLPLVSEGAADALEARGARLHADASIQRGGVLVQSDVGAVDARIGVRWAQAAAALGSALPLEGDAA